MSDKAIRSAKLTAAGILEKRRAETAVNRAGGQIAPSKYLPDVPRAVHAAGGAAMFQGIHPDLQNESGAPLDLYHGTTQDKAFEAFDNAKLGKRDAGFYGSGHYLTPIKGNAEGYADPDEMGAGTVMGPLHAALKNPYVWDVSDKGSHRTLRDLQAMGIMKEKSELNPWDNLQRHHIKPFMSEMQKRGHDGVIVKTENGLSEVVAFNPNTIKHRDAEVFDPNDPRIMRADGGKVAFMQGNHPDVPHVMYHGTGASKDFTSFLMPGNKTGRKTGGNAIYLSTSPETASTFASYGQNPRVIPAHVSAKNPFDFRNPEHIDALQGSLTKNFKSWFPGAMYGPQTAINWMRGGDFGLLENDNVRSWMKRRGHDGYFVTEGEGKPLNLAVFKPEQVKSAIGNQGTFDPKDPDMTRADGGRVGKAYGGSYVPQAALPQLRLAVAQPLPQQQPQGGSWLNTLTDLAVATKKEPEAMAPQSPGPSGASGVHPPQEGVSASAQDALNALRSAWTGQPINVISGYRDPKKNEAVGGAKGSQHLHGNAFDFDTGGWSEADKLALAQAARNAGFQGFGFYDNNLHFDVGAPRVWGPSHHSDSVPQWAQGFADGGKVTDSENFQSWFGNSVTHTDGQPHVLYTGTSKDKDFTGFNVGRHGAWFTRDPEVASSYAEQNDSQGYRWEGGRPISTNTASRVIPAYVKAENPYTGELPDEAIRGKYKSSQSDWFDKLRRMGHDAWMPASQGGNLVVALKEPQQIKSVYNSGKFDPKQKHIGKAEGGPIEGTQNAETSTGAGQAGTQAFGLPGSGNVRGGQSLLPSSVQPSGEEDLIGLPKSVSMPKLGQTITASHDPRIRQVARDYASTSGIDYRPPTTYRKVDPVRAKRIADAYEAMPHEPNHPLVKASYEALLNETKGQYEAMKRAGLNLEFYPDPNDDPYKSNPRLAVEDVKHNNHMYVYPTDAGYGTGEALPGTDENPMLRDSGERWNGKPVLFNDLFRAVHDYFGHAKEGVGFRADGEENAWRQHAAMFSPLARIALGTETRGQNSWLNYGPHGDKNRTAATEDTVFADQKLGVLPHWVHHEGAEDFINPQERKQMEEIYKAHGKTERFPAWSRSEFTPEKFSSALKSSPFASTLTQYDASEIKDMVNKGKFSGYKLAGKDAYFGIKHDANYAEDYGFEHPALTGNEKALVGVVNNDKTARGVGDSLMQEAIKQGVTALDAFAVPSDKHPRGFLTDFYAKHGFKELGRVPFDPKYVTPEQFADMKRAWKESGWDEKRHPMPDVAIMKRASGGAVMAKHTLTQGFSNGGAARLMKARKVKPVDIAMSLTRRFTKDGAGATMALKSKGN